MVWHGWVDLVSVATLTEARSESKNRPLGSYGACFQNAHMLVEGGACLYERRRRLAGGGG